MIKNKKILCVVTARAGSKGIPMKNVRKLLGKPLFMWSILASLESKYIDKTVISSNCDNVFKEYCNFYKEADDKLKDYFNQDKIQFIHRPDEISGDLSKNEDALIHVLNWEKSRIQNEYDFVVNLQPTSPCRLEGLLDKCIKKYYDGGYDSLLIGTKNTPFIWQKVDGKWKYTVDKNHCCDRKMRQQFNESEFIWHDNGCIYIVDTKILLDRRCRIGDNPYIYETSGINNIQIDTEFDFKLIENMAKAYNLNSLI